MGGKVREEEKSRQRAVTEGVGSNGNSRSEQRKQKTSGTHDKTEETPTQRRTQEE